MAAARSPCLAMLSGKPMPQVGLGTWLSKPGEVGNAVKVAIEAGYRHIDTARSYLNEGEIGVALEECIKAGKVTRDEVFITTKLAGGALVPSRVREQTDKSLKLLRTDHVDLLLIHYPLIFSDVKLNDDPPSFYPFEDGAPQVLDTDPLEAYKEMEKLVDDGLVKAIGLSNFNKNQIQRIWDESRIKPANLQVECHAWFPQYELADFCKEKGITFSAYAPIGSPGRPYEEVKDNVLMDHEVIVKLAKKLKRTPAQILLRNLIQRGLIVLPKSVKDERIISNFQLFDFSLSDAEMEEIKVINREWRMFHLGFFKHEKISNHPHLPYPLG